MPDGTGTFAVLAHNRFLAYDMPTYYCKWGSPNSHITPRQFSTQLEFYFIGLLTVYLYLNCSRRKVNIVSHLLPVSVWSIVSREIILLPAELMVYSEPTGQVVPTSGQVVDSTCECSGVSTTDFYELTGSVQLKLLNDRCSTKSPLPRNRPL